MTKCADLANLIGNINAGGGGVNRNVIINGAMNVAQRATSSTGLGASTGYFVCDRFNFAVNGTAGRVTATQDSSAPSGFANSTKIDVTTADTSVAAGEYFIFQQRIEGQNLQGFAKGTSDAKPFAVSFYVKGNASATYCCELFDGDNSRQASKLFSVTTDWTRVELTFDADTTGAFDDDNATSFELNIWLHAGSNFTSGTLNQTFASNDNTKRASGISSIFDSTDRTFFITGVQLEVGQNPTEFEHEPITVTENKCFRYFENFMGANAHGGSYGASGYYIGHIQYKVRKRTQPTASNESGGNISSVATSSSGSLGNQDSFYFIGSAGSYVTQVRIDAEL
tara:strand:+ start:8 stop:1024 length:1017 start_codon:yes stop_codon:yes gene_type:complete